ncbi:hypothetical protein B0H10DRAFT_2439065 [Mycena sp. CBHHK59/15]|nr:hypothetical protein B0H10DRAFT_2439065 [Mycena sp. CBHHK59/15]
MNSRSIDPAVILPPEILAKIFDLCNPRAREWSSVPDEIYNPMSEAPWLLSHVSSHWRCIALSTPMLWCFLYVLHWNARGLFQLVRLFVDRSKSTPISLSLFLFEIPTEARPILELLMRESDRWEGLMLHGNITDIRSLSPIRGHLHRLRRLAIIPEGRPEDFDPPHIDIFSEAPCLRTVETFDPEFYFVLPWNQLTEFITWYSDSEIMPLLHVLQELTHLVTLRLARLKPDDIGEVGPAAHLPHLRSLKIIFDDLYGHPGDLLDHLLAPALDSLSIDCEDLAVVPHLTSFVSRSACTLASFSLTAVNDIDSALIDFLKLTPRLTRLCLHSLWSAGVSGELLTQLTRMRPATSPPVLPLLASLLVRGVFNQALLFGLVASRFSPDPEDRLLRLKTLELFIEAVDLEPVLTYGLDALVGMGLEWCIKTDIDDLDHTVFQ